MFANSGVFKVFEASAVSNLSIEVSILFNFCFHCSIEVCA